MLILQASYLPNYLPQLALWGEVPHHPLGPSPYAAAGGSELAQLWQPGRAGEPVPSQPALLDSPPQGKGKLQLRPFTYPVQALGWEELLSLEEGDGVFHGSTLKFWRQLLRFATELVARQRFLPGLHLVDKHWQAAWDAHLSATDRERLERLSQAMPEACRAMTVGQEMPVLAPSSVAWRVLQAWVDALVRQSPQKLKLHPQSIHEKWVQALTCSQPIIDCSRQEGQALQQQVLAWRQSLATLAASPYRLLLRLEEPPSEQAPWQVGYWLQSVADPSLLIQPEQAQGAARQALLLALGQAAQLDARIEKSLRGQLPQGYECDAQGAYEFLECSAPLLQQADFAVQLPAWWTSKRTRLGVRAKVRKSALRADSGLHLQAILEVDWELALGPHSISLQELEKLARLKQPLVSIRGQWVHLSAADIKAGLESWKKRQKSLTRLGDLVSLSLGQADPQDDLEFQGVEAEGWVAEFLGQLQGIVPLQEETVPAEFQGRLRPYQGRGYSWLCFMQRWGLGACLADDMGLGKTVQALCFLQSRWNQEKAPSLLVCPTSVLGNWAKECTRFTPQLPWILHHGPRRGNLAKLVQGQALVLTSYALLQRDHAQLAAIPWAAVVLDEAQNIKNSQTKQARAARSLTSPFRLAMTGTPVENHVGDLWSLCEFWQPGLLGSSQQFKSQFLLPIQRDGDAEATQRLKRLTGPFILRRLKTDASIVDDLPEKLEMKVYCTLTQEQASLYAAVVREASEALDESQGIQRQGLVLATLTRLKQVCNHPAHFLGDRSALADRSGKLTRLTEMLREVLDNGERALIFTQFTEMGDILRRHLQHTLGQEVLFLHGGQTKKVRDEMVERFQAGGPALFLLSLKAGGVGLNLTAANHVFHFDRWWNPAVENQATDRAFRIGQKRNVSVHKFVCLGTVEEKVDDMIERKLQLAGKLVGTGEHWLSQLSTQDLKELFQLRQEALL